MFTGLIKEIGKIAQLNEHHGKTFIIESEKVLSLLELGSSVSINGACQTVTQLFPGSFQCFTSPETLRVSNLSTLKPGDRVNLEPALTLNTPLDGHLVQGHVDAQAKVVGLNQTNAYATLELEIPKDLIHYVVEKGSIAINGVSLTVNVLLENRIQLLIIPLTLQSTNLQWIKQGDWVNVETDYLVKSVFRFISLSKSHPSQITTTFLEEHGFF